MANDAGMQIVEDGSIEAAAALMPDLGPSLEELESRKPQPRDPQSQQWRSPDEQPRAKRVDQVEQEAAPADEEAEADQVSPVDEEFFEVEEERDGKKVPVRLKASEVWAEAQEAKRVRQEFEEYRMNSIPPEQWDQQVLHMTQARNQLLRQLHVQRQTLNPIEPDPELMNPASVRHNPDLYYQQVMISRQQKQQLAGIEENIQRYEYEQQQQMQALTAAQMQREKTKLHKFWPEIADGKEAARVRDEAIKHWGKYGVSDELIGSVHNSAFYAILKDAIAYRRGQQAREAAVKVVRAKPKLVRAQARDNANPSNRRSQDGFRRLQANPTDMQAAVDALDGLIS